LDTLGAAYAAAGDFSKAIETAEKALELCRSSEQNTLKEKIENRIVLYKAGKPYIETQ
jgi:tetratricopeptide (TPR) repeat protein